MRKAIVISVVVSGLLACCIVALVLLVRFGAAHNRREEQASDRAQDVRQVIENYQWPPNAKGSLPQDFRASGRCEPTEIDYTISHTFTNGNKVSVSIAGDLFWGTYRLQMDQASPLPPSQQKFFDHFVQKLHETFERYGWSKEE